jgi:quercetin dioxygenase-like cupin family protein
VLTRISLGASEALEAGRQILRIRTVVAACILSSTIVVAQEQPVPVVQEPYHHVKLQNDDIVVINAVLPPGERTAYHIHSCDRTGVEISTNTTTGQKFGEAEGKPQLSVPGDVFSDSCTGEPLVHRVHNVGTTTMEVIDIELLHRPEHPSTSVAGPIAIENPSVRVYKWEIAPAKSTAMHTHTRPYLIVAVTPMQLKMTAPDGQSRSEAVKAGDFHWVNVPVTHSLANEGAGAGQIVEFELK